MFSGYVSNTTTHLPHSSSHDGSSVEAGFEPGTLRLQGRGLTTRSPRPAEVFYLDDWFFLLVFQIYQCGAAVNVSLKATFVELCLSVGLPFCEHDNLKMQRERRLKFGSSWYKCVESITRFLTAGDLAVRSRLGGWRIPGSRTESTEDPPCMWACCTLNHT
ncbi:hypothetical protein AVEN_186424-1 [Araneus ventricosus]|uniref:Uncharacterized protein n=1 Tax=Araneus ventricosus TaxID=182803 RepID=A0A4Y2RJG4_ARAVE|nr:hypothetical protein AVEN_186424-1 [Araneus ventricosus]